MDNCGSFHFVQIQFMVFSAKQMSPGYQDVYTLFHTKTNRSTTVGNEIGSLQ